MMKFLFQVSFTIMIISIFQSEIIENANNDIRDTIMVSFKDKPKKELFKIFHFLFQKKYNLDSEEGINKYKIFKNNLKFIENQNKIQKSYQLGITEFTDLTANEFREAYLNGISEEINVGI